MVEGGRSSSSNSSRSSGSGSGSSNRSGSSTSKSLQFVTAEELELLKPWLRDKVQEVLGYEEETVYKLAVESLQQHHSQEVMQQVLQELLQEAALPFVQEVFQQFPRVRQLRTQQKRKREQTKEHEEEEEEEEEEVGVEVRGATKEKEEKKKKYKKYKKDEEEEKEEEEEAKEELKEEGRESKRNRREERGGHREKRDREERRHHRHHEDREKREREERRERREKEREREHRRSTRSSERKEKEEEYRSRTGRDKKEEERGSERKRKRSLSPRKVEEKEKGHKGIAPPAVEIKLSTQKLPSEGVSSSSSSSSNELKPATAPAIALPTDLTTLMQNLAKSKEALQHQLEQQKKEKQQTALLKKTIEAQKAHKKEPTSTAAAAAALEKARKLGEKVQELSKTDSKGKVDKEQDGLIMKANRKLPGAQQDSGADGTGSKKSAVFFDPNLGTPKSDRPKRSFNFLTAGSIVKKGDKMRAEAARERGEIVDIIPDESEDKVTTKKSKEVLPTVEWWDKFLLPNGTYDDFNNKFLDLSEVTMYVEHPVPSRPPGEKEPPPVSIYLTKAEQKKLRKRTRAEREKERQERVLLGLESAPGPKVKISNLMRVLGSEATADPTQIEQEVRRQMAERVANHEARNQARKLTKEQKKEKKKAKFIADSKLSTQASLFRIRDLTDPRHKFKIDINAKEMFLSGCAILYKDLNFVLVEGGHKAIRKFNKLMTRRIDWSQHVEKEEAEDSESKMKVEETTEKPQNTCDLIWTGSILKPNFQQFRFETLTSEDAIRKYLSQRWAEHYFDMVKNYQGPNEEE